jgi:hypothetical protein
MILFNDIIQILTWPDEIGLGEHALLLKRLECRGISYVLVHGDHTRREHM